MNLEANLAEIREESAAKFDPETKAEIARANKELRDSGIIEKALTKDGQMPAFSLRTSDGIEVESSSLLETGPLVVNFYRGVW